MARRVIGEREVEVVSVSSVAEERRLAAESPCPACGGGCDVERQTLLEGGVDLLELRCTSCGELQEVYFDISSFLEKGSELPGM